MAVNLLTMIQDSLRHSQQHHPRYQHRPPNTQLILSTNLSNLDALPRESRQTSSNSKHNLEKQLVHLRTPHRPHLQRLHQMSRTILLLILPESPTSLSFPISTAIPPASTGQHNRVYTLWNLRQ